MATISMRIVQDRWDQVRLFELLVADGIADALFYENTQKDMGKREASWLVLTLPQHAWLCELAIDGRTAAVVWFNGFTGKAAYIHFAVLRHAAPHAVALGQYVCAWAFSEGLVALLGVTPEKYRHALAVVYGVGFEEKLRVPGCCYLARYNKHCAGVVTMLTPERLREARK